MQERVARKQEKLKALQKSTAGGGQEEDETDSGRVGIAVALAAPLTLHNSVQ